MPLPHARIHTVRSAAMIVALFPILMMSGCWTFSIQPLFDGASDPDLIFDQSQVGSWGRVVDGCNLTLTIQANARAYDMTLAPGQGCKDDENKTTHYLAYLVKLDTHRYLDISPKQTDVCDLCFPAHTFAQLSLENNTFSVTPLDGDWLDKEIKEKKIVLTHVGGDGEVDITLNALPAEMKAFLRKYAEDADAFKASQRSVFTRK